MEQPGSAKVKAQASEPNEKKRTLFLITILCVVAVVATVGSLVPGGSAAAPSVEPGTLLFADDFVDNQNGWTADSGVYVEGGELHVACNTPGESAPVWFCTPAEFDNIGFEVQATKVSGPDQQYGLIFGTENGEFFLFGLAENGLYCFTRWTGSDWFYITDYTYSPYVNQAGEPNTLAVCRRDQAIELYVNGEYLQTVPMRSEIEKSIGLFVGMQGMHVSFDNVMVYEVL